MTREVVNKMNSDSYFTKTVTITLRDSNFNTINRQKTLDDYTNDYLVIFDCVAELLEENIEDKSYRLVGMGVSNLVLNKNLPKEYNLFTLDSIDEKEEAINSLIKEFQDKYGEKILYRSKKNKTCK